MTLPKVDRSFVTIDVCNLTSERVRIEKYPIIEISRDERILTLEYDTSYIIGYHIQYNTLYLEFDIQIHKKRVPSLCHKVITLCIPSTLERIISIVQCIM